MVMTRQHSPRHSTGVQYDISELLSVRLSWVKTDSTSKEWKVATTFKIRSLELENSESDSILDALIMRVWAVVFL